MVSVQSICDAATHDEEPTVETTEAFFPVRSKTELKSEGFSRRCSAAYRVVLWLEAAGWQHIQNLTTFVIVWTSEKFSLSFKPLRNWCSFCVTSEHDAAERDWMLLALHIISIFLPRGRPTVLGGYFLLHISSIRENLLRQDRRCYVGASRNDGVRAFRLEGRVPSSWRCVQSSHGGPAFFSAIFSGSEAEWRH